MRGGFDLHREHRVLLHREHRVLAITRVIVGSGGFRDDIGGIRAELNGVGAGDRGPRGGNDRFAVLYGESCRLDGRKRGQCPGPRKRKTILERRCRSNVRPAAVLHDTRKRNRRTNRECAVRNNTPRDQVGRGVRTTKRCLCT